MTASINRVTHTRSTELVWGYIHTIAGPALMAAIANRICTLDLRTGPVPEQQLSDDWPDLVRRRDDALMVALYGEAESQGSPALAVSGTDFQCQVWQALCAIPAGETRTYGELARALGRPGAARAVGSAAAANRIALLIPCHRLVPASGGCGAFRWGAERKMALLEAESGRHAIYGQSRPFRLPDAHIS